MGLVYTVHGNMFWATRANADSETDPWLWTRIYTNQADDFDPYGSHFSVAVDAQSNVHVAFADGSQLKYLRMTFARSDWTLKTLANPAHTAYMQMLVTAAGPLMIVFNNDTTLGVLQSTDGGKTWAATHALTHPNDGADYSNPRTESPSTRSGNPVPVLQQYVDGAVQRALEFQVPVVTSP